MCIFSFLVLLKEMRTRGWVQDFIFLFLVLIKRIRRQGESKISTLAVEIFYSELLRAVTNYWEGDLDEERK